MPDINEHLPTEELEHLLGDETPEDAARLREVWKVANSSASESFPDSARIKAVWVRVESQIKPESGDRGPVSHGPRLRRVPRFVLSAAAVLLVLAVGMGYWTRTDTYFAPNGERLSVGLRDGSAVELNSGSELRFRRSLTGSRVVSLNGEAFFNVEQGTGSFIVNTFNGVIEVVGTEFNVRAWREGPGNRTSVSLLSGRLRLSNRSYPESGVFLQPGETRHVLSGESVPTSADATLTAHATAWRDGDLIFKDTMVQIALDEIERRFDLEIELSAASYRQKMVSVAFRSPASAEGVINDLAQALGLNYRQISNGFEIYEPGH